MSKSRNGGKAPKELKTAKPAKRKEQESPKKKSQRKHGVSGFSTLSQVAGVPKKRIYHSDIPVPEARTVEEPSGILCAICNEPIDSIASAIAGKDGGYVHFDCVLESIKKEEELRDNQSISYIGSGNFAICEKGEDGRFSIIKRIPYESEEQHHKLVDFVEGLKK